MCLDQRLTPLRSSRLLRDSATGTSIWSAHSYLFGTMVGLGVVERSMKPLPN